MKTLPNAIKLSKADAIRAFVRYHFRPATNIRDAFHRLRSVQFDPIAPVGCNHDLVLQARVPGYRVGDWERLAYDERHIYDGWDKQASLVPFEGWPVRRIFHQEHRKSFEKKIFEDHADAVKTILDELERRGPLMPKDCEFQGRREEWKGSWLGPSVTKQTLRALWHSGLVMTSGRKNGQHLYDLTERVVPEKILNTPAISDEDAVCELILERHRAMGMLRPNASAEIWSYGTLRDRRKAAFPVLVDRADLIPVEVEGMLVHATPEFLHNLDQPSIAPRVVFVAPLDPFMWDRKMILELFGFEYAWEIYTPEARRRWGYYVLPVLFGDRLVARVEFFCRAGVLEVRRWQFESDVPGDNFLAELEIAMRQFMHYASATTIRVEPGVPVVIRELTEAI